MAVTIPSLSFVVVGSRRTTELAKESKTLGTEADSVGSRAAVDDP
jgi:hypothetical protein